MRFLVFLLVAGSAGQSALAQVADPTDTLATHLQLPGADCAVFAAQSAFPHSDTEEDEYKLDMKRFTPTTEQVTAAEQALLTVQLDHVSASTESNDDYDAYPRIIKKHLKEFQRQYYGFYNKQQHACLFINLFLEKHEEGVAESTAWRTHVVQVMDGGWEYWSVYYDLTAHKFFHYAHAQQG